MSILSKKQAFMLGRSETIDLKYINAKEYTEKVEGISPIMKKARKISVALGVMGYIAVCFYGWLVLYPQEAEAGYTSENTAFLSRFGEEKRVIGCYNDITKKARQESRCTMGGDHNIILPSRSDIEIWLKYFNESEILNRLALVNFESSFDPGAGNVYAKGYVQTLRKWNISPDIDSQLSWVKNRMEAQKVKYTKGGSKRCGYYWDNDNIKDGFSAGEYGVLSCLYRYHYHAYDGTWYAKRGIEATEYYKWYMFDQRGKTFEEYKK